MLKIFAHADLSHEFVLVAVHSRELANMSENVLKTVGQLERVHVVQAVLDVRVDNQLGETKDLAAQMKSCNSSNA